MAGTLWLKVANRKLLERYIQGQSVEFEISKFNMARYNCVLRKEYASANMKKKIEQIEQLNDSFH